MSDQYYELYQQCLLERSELLTTIKRLEQNRADLVDSLDRMECWHSYQYPEDKAEFQVDRKRAKELVARYKEQEK